MRSRALYLATAIVSAVLVIGVGAAYSNVSQDRPLVDDAHVSEGRNPQKPNEIEFRTGVPLLMAIEMPYIESLYYHEVKEGEYGFIDRTVGKGAALISDSEMDVFFNTFSDEGNRFAITSKDGLTEYYSIDYFEPPLSLTNHHVNVLLYASSDSITNDVAEDAKPLSIADRPYISNAVVKPYRWTEINDESASELRSLLQTEGKTFRVSTESGEEIIRLMYLGPLSEELDDPEFRSMYNLAPIEEEGQ